MGLLVAISRDLTVAFDGTQVLHGIDLDVAKGEALGLVGESGCGKSVTWLAALGLLPGKATRRRHRSPSTGRSLSVPRATALEGVRGGRIAMIFQDPSTSLNPVHPGRSPDHRGARVFIADWRARRARIEAIRLMDMVGIPDAEQSI